MEHSIHDLSFDNLETLFLDLNLDATPSMFHGFVCGILIRGGIDELLVFEKLEEWLFLSSEQTEVLQKFLFGYMNVVDSDLRDLNYGFQPLLPTESVALDARLNAIAEWCRHFLSGLADVWDGQFETTEDTIEALKDLAEVANVSSDAEPDGESDFEYLLEHVRILVQVIYSDLHRSD